MWHFFGVERVKCFVKVHLHCIVNNLKSISKRSTLSPLEKIPIVESTYLNLSQAIFSLKCCLLFPAKHFTSSLEC